MTRFRLLAVAALLLALVGAAPEIAAQKPSTVASYLSPGYPVEVVSAARAERIAWIAYEEGKRNAYTAAAPAFSPVRLTSFMKDDGVDMTTVRISADGSVVVFVRGHAPNREGWVANPSSNPDGADRTIWAARTAAPGVAWKVAEGASPELAPDGSAVLFARDGQIYRATTSQARPAAARDRGEEPFITAWGTNNAPRWSPDGKYISFVSQRTDHSFIGIYEVATRTLKYMAPGVDFDSSPTWSEDSKRIAFIRRPGLAFGQQAQQGVGSLGNPNGPAFNPQNAAGTRRTRRGRRARSGGTRRARRRRRHHDRTGPRPRAIDVPRRLHAFDVDRQSRHRRGLGVLAHHAGRASLHVHQQHSVGGRSRDLFGHAARRRMGSLVLAARRRSHDSGADVAHDYGRHHRRRDVVANFERRQDAVLHDQSRRHRSPRHLGCSDRRGSAETNLEGAGIETYPMPFASGQRIAAFYADARRPMSVSVIQTTTGEQKVIYPSLPASFPMAAHVDPTAVTLKAADGFEFYNQLFLPKDIKPGEKRPAMVFVHGGPVRQMLLGYHYRHFYHMAYAVNQWLASQGYIVLSVNFRSGVGYGRSFRTAARTGGAGNSEYGDVLAAGKYLHARPDVDTKRVAIWGLSYGGVLTAQALARNSDLFAAGIDLAGVHLWGSSLDPESVSYQSSAISSVDKWKSPVLLIHGDDDRNVAFQQTTGLVQLLRQRDVEYELIVFPDDVHDSLLHSRWIYTFERMDKFLKKHLTGN